MRIGDIALIRGGLDLIDRQGGEYDPMAAKRLAVRGEHGSAVIGDGLAQLVNGRAGRAVRELVGKEPN